MHHCRKLAYLQWCHSLRRSGPERLTQTQHCNTSLSPIKCFIDDYAAVFINAYCLLIVFVLDMRQPWVPWKVPSNKMYYIIIIIIIIIASTRYVSVTWHVLCFVLSSTWLHILLGALQEPNIMRAWCRWLAKILYISSFLLDFCLSTVVEYKVRLVCYLSDTNLFNCQPSNLLHCRSRVCTERFYFKNGQMHLYTCTF